MEAIRALIETIPLEPDGDELEDHAEGDLAGMSSGQRRQEVARNRRPPGPNKAGCGGVQPSEFGVCLGCCVVLDQLVAIRPSSTEMALLALTDVTTSRIAAITPSGCDRWIS
jgi:hypothetical protein